MATGREHETELDKILAEYLVRMDAGEAVDRQRFLAQHPRVAAELASYFEAADEVHRAVGELARVPPGSTGTTVAPTVPASFSQSAAALRLEGFEVLGEIGRGGMGLVYRAVQLRLNREVALKVLPPALASDPDRLLRFRNEASVAAALNESHILPIFDIVESDGVPVLVMPYVDGCDLGRIIHDRKAHLEGRVHTRRHPWSQMTNQVYLEHVLGVLDQLVEALALLHAGDILHRDIKPSNVLVDRRGQMWLTDFGLARLGRQSGITQPGAAVGTAGYMSPEQARGAEDVDGRADVFSTGATIYQALTLEYPFGKEVIGPAQPPPRRPSQHQSLVSRDMDAVLLKALEPDREERYGSAVELLADWRSVRQGLLPKARTRGRVHRSARWMRRNPWPLTAAVLAVLLAGMLGALLSDQSPHPTVKVSTVPPGAVGVLVPLDAQTGAPMAQGAIFPSHRRDRLLFDDVPPGEYLVEVEVPGHGFHQVYRTVPREIDLPGGYAHNRWTWESKRRVLLEPITIPPAGYVNDMVRLDGGPFRMGSDDIEPMIAPPFHAVVPTFLLDQSEVTLAEYRQHSAAPEQHLDQWGSDGNMPVTCVTFDEALAFAERIGKRLPTEMEYEFAATNAGVLQFPWGDSAEEIGTWAIGLSGASRFDQTAHDPPIDGLYSSVAEWTVSWLVPYPSAPPDAMKVLPAEYRTWRVVRGGEWEVVEGRSIEAASVRGPRFRMGITRSNRHPGLGFRCARSIAPEFLYSRRAQ